MSKVNIQGQYMFLSVNLVWHLDKSNSLWSGVELFCNIAVKPRDSRLCIRLTVTLNIYAIDLFCFMGNHLSYDQSTDME